MEDFIIPITEKKQALPYEMRRIEKAELMGGKSSNAINMFFSLENVGQCEGLTCFDYIVSDRNQTNHSGLFAWAEDMQFLTSKLVLGISSEGSISRIFNQQEIRRIWNDKGFYECKKKHRGEANTEAMLQNVSKLVENEKDFISSLSYAPPFSILFSNLHKQVFQNKKASGREGRISGVGGVSYIPLLIDDTLSLNEKKESTEYEVQSVGDVNKAEFNEEKFNNFVRTLSDDPTVTCNLSVKYSERYLFDSQFALRQAMCLHLSAVPYFMLREEMCLIKSTSI